MNPRVDSKEEETKYPILWGGIGTDLSVWELESPFLHLDPKAKGTLKNTTLVNSAATMIDTVTVDASVTTSTFTHPGEGPVILFSEPLEWKTILGQENIHWIITLAAHYTSPVPGEGFPEATPRSPFEQLEERRSEEEKIADTIDYIRREPEVPFSRRIADRLQYLVEVRHEEDSDQTPLSPDSLSWFFYLLRSRDDWAYPDIVVSPSGNIRAEWHAAMNRHFAVEFSVNGLARFIVFAPETRHPVRTRRLSGIIPVEFLIETVEAFGVLQWSTQVGN